MDFSLSAELRTLQERTRRFVDEIVIPREAEFPHEDQHAWPALRQELQRQARQAGLFLPNLKQEWGGLGLNWRDCAVVFICPR